MLRLLPFFLWPAVAVGAQIIGFYTLEGLYLSAYGPEAAAPHARHIAPAYTWLAVHGFISVFAGLATTWWFLRRAHLGLAVPVIVLIALPVTTLGTFSLYLLAACLGVV